MTLVVCTGTATEIGKTWVGAAVLSHLRAAGTTVAARKPVQSFDSDDTGPTDAVAALCNGCDVLVHEVYSTAGFARRAPEWQNYHAKYHTSSAQLAEVAKKAHPGVLVLYHQLFWGTSEADLLAEVASRYSGKVVSGHDLDVF